VGALSLGSPEVSATKLSRVGWTLDCAVAVNALHPKYNTTLLLPLPEPDKLEQADEALSNTGF
jgi:hypothetical protein